MKWNQKAMAEMGEQGQGGVEDKGVQTTNDIWPWYVPFLSFLYYTNYLLTCRLRTSTNTSPSLCPPSLLPPQGLETCLTCLKPGSP